MLSLLELCLELPTVAQAGHTRCELDRLIIGSPSCHSRERSSSADGRPTVAEVVSINPGRAYVSVAGVLTGHLHWFAKSP